MLTVRLPAPVFILNTKNTTFAHFSTQWRTSSEADQAWDGKVTPLPSGLDLHNRIAAHSSAMHCCARHCIRLTSRLYSTEILTIEYTQVRVFRAFPRTFPLISLLQSSW